MPFSTRELHQVSVESIISPQMLYQGSHSPVDRSLLGQAQHTNVQELFARQQLASIAAPRSTGSDWTKVQPRTQHPPPHLAPEQTLESSQAQHEVLD